MCIYIPHQVVALLNILPFVLIGGVFGFFLGEAWAKFDYEYEERENEKNKKRRL